MVCPSRGGVDRRMELFGHAASGVALAQILRPPGDDGRWFWPLTGAAFALAPDVDAVAWLIGGPELFTATHQYYTHNLLVFAVVPPLAAWAVARRAPAGTPPRRVLALVWGAWTLHLLGDTIASWPVRLFWPFSRGGVAFDLIPRDFSVGIPLILVAGIGLGYTRELATYRRPLAAAALVAAVGWVFGPGW